MSIILCQEILGVHHCLMPKEHEGPHECHCSFFWGYENADAAKALEYYESPDEEN